MINVLGARSQARLLAQTRQDLTDITQSLGAIERLRHAPKVAALQLESPAEIANRLNEALQEAGLTESDLMKQDPSSPQRVQRTDFEVRTTVIELGPAELPKILRFCQALRDPETGTVVRDITLSAPRNGGSGGSEELWESQLVLTQMIFSPTSP